MKNQSTTKKNIISLIFLLSVALFYGQIRVANNPNNVSAPNSSAFIDASSTTQYNSSSNIGKGLLYPRTDLTGFTSFGGSAFGIGNNYPTYYDGFMVYNTATSGVAGVGSTEGTLCRGFWYYDNVSKTLNGGIWRPLNPALCSPTTPVVVSSLDCGSRTISGTLTENTVASGVSVTLPYTGGNGASYTTQNITSKGVDGLTATLQPGVLTNGTGGNLVFDISGTPAGSGDASFTFSLGVQTCTFTMPVNPSGPRISTLECTSAVDSGSITQGVDATGVFISIPYTGGNGVAYLS